MPPVGNKFYACILCNKRTKPGERRRVCHSLSRFLAKNFLLNRNLRMSFATNVEEGIIDRRNRIPPRQLIARNSVNQMMIIRHQHQNLEETIIYLVHLLLDYQYHQHQKPTHIAFYARNLITSLSTYHPKQDYLHFFTTKL